MITVITLRGTGERVGSSENMLRYVTNKLDPAKYEIGPDIDYPATIGPANPQGNPLGISEEQSIAQSLDLIAAAIRATPNKVGILGYSLGASCVSRFLERKAAGQYADCELAWAGVVANPWRAPGESIDPNPVYFGISGAHGPWPAGLPVYTAANPQDGITSCPSPSPLRSLADGVDNFTFARLDWTLALAGQLAVDAAQQAALSLNPVETAEHYVQAAALMRGYLIDGQHFWAYVRQGYTDRLAAALNAHS